MISPTYVVSSNIDAIGYKFGTLFIRFKSGTVYSYADVNYKVFDALAQAESVGQFFHRCVRSRYEYTKLDYDPFLKRAA